MILSMTFSLNLDSSVYPCAQVYSSRPPVPAVH